MQSDVTYPSRREERLLCAGVFLVSLAVLLLQISLTRLFSFSIWYHFAYVTISVALLGYGASGALLAILPALAGAAPARRLSAYALSAGALIVVGLLVFAHVPFHPFQLIKEPGRQLVFMIAYYVAVTTPFFFAGLCMSVALRTLSHRVSRLYFFDLLGAGLGCLLVVFVIAALSTPGAVIAAAVIISLAGVVFAAADVRGVNRQVLATAVIAVAGIVAVTRTEFSPSPEKFLALYLGNPQQFVHYNHRWTPIFRTDVYGYRNEDQSRVISYAGWGISPFWKEKAATEAPRLRAISHDGDACAVIYNFDGDLSKLEMFEHNILKTPYLLVDHPNVLVIGVGGGADIVNAIKNGARHVTGIELDPVTVDTVKYDQADFAGHIYDRPDVTIIAGEGRSTVRHSGALYDLIQMTGVDTLAALSTGAYVLSESYLYTTQAVGEFLAHLTPDGVLSIINADFDGKISGYPRHTMRQLSLISAALQQRGIDDPSQHVAVLASTEEAPEVNLLVKTRPFTAAASQRLQEFADQMGFQVWARPGTALSTPHSEFLRKAPAEREAYIAAHPLNLTPTTDDNPFFFNFYQWRNLGSSRGELDTGHTLATGQIVLALILLLSIGFSALLILLPLVVFQRQGLHTEGKWGFIAFFLGIGLGFIFVEISFVQKFVLFLGYPTYSLSVVLFSLLTYSGIGSFLTGRMQAPPERRLLPLMAGLTTVLLLSLVLLPQLFDAFLGSALPVRIVLASAALVPLGLLMGMFFPTGIQIVRLGNVSFVPWAWGINGCASVVGTVLAVILAMSYGFRFVTLLALTTYVVAVVGLAASARRVRGVAP